MDMTEDEKWLARARKADFMPSLLARRAATMSRSDANEILAQPRAFDTLSVAAAIEVQSWA